MRSHRDVILVTDEAAGQIRSLLLAVANATSLEQIPQLRIDYHAAMRRDRRNLHFPCDGHTMNALVAVESCPVIKRRRVCDFWW